MDYARVLAYVTGTVEQELLVWNEYRAAEIHFPKAQLEGRDEARLDRCVFQPPRVLLIN
jgi:hypothetical protein